MVLQDCISLNKFFLYKNFTLPLPPVLLRKVILGGFPTPFHLFCLSLCHHRSCDRRKRLAAMQWMQTEHEIKLTQWNYSYYPYLYSDPVPCVAHLCRNASSTEAGLGIPACLAQDHGSAFPLCCTAPTGIPGNLSSPGKWGNKANSQCRMQQKPQTFQDKKTHFSAS